MKNLTDPLQVSLMETNCALDTGVCTGACGHSHPSREGAQDWIYHGLPFDLLRIDLLRPIISKGAQTCSFFSCPVQNLIFKQ